jgi:hypothetical protein
MPQPNITFTETVRPRTGEQLRGIWLKKTGQALARMKLIENPGSVYLFEGLEKGLSYPPRTVQKIYDNACKKARIQRRGGIYKNHSDLHSCESGRNI